MNILSGLGHGWHNVTDANGLTITIIGMLLVFFSLALLAAIIGLTPLLLKVIGKIFPEEEHSAVNGVKKVSETDVVAAISVALCHTMKSSNKQI